LYRTSVVIIGAGQAGLAVSRLLTEASVDHVILERGSTAESWRSQRWDSLRLLTPNWMSRLPGWAYRGPDPDGFMSAASVVDYLGRYAASFRAPVFQQVQVHSVSWTRGRFVVDSDAGSWTADSVVVATGYCHEPAVPAIARALHPSIRQLTPDRYRNPDDVPDGGVLVVGGSATGVQLADELAAHGCAVTLAVGRHTRVPRRYRGVDIMRWLDSMGLLDRPIRPADAKRPEPSLQIVGDAMGREVGLLSLSARGIRITGRVTGLDRGVVKLADDLPVTAPAADARLDRLLDRIDHFAASTGLDSSIGPPIRPAASIGARCADQSGRISLHASGFRSIIWATGYRPRYPWLQLPVLGGDGEIRQTAGRTPVKGLLVVGMRSQSRRSSTFLDGVRHDAATVVDHLVSAVLPSAGRRAS
jgi:putative flavoprotein involved in K+ transport